MKKFLFFDCETTGLEPDKCHMLEIAAIVTDENLIPLDFFTAIISQPISLLENMDEWCTRTHTDSGLLDSVLNIGQPQEAVEESFVKFIEKNFPGERGKVIIAGNTISFDRSFLKVHMPKVHEQLHYRSLDVTGFLIVTRDMMGCVIEKGKGTHRALEDALESIAGLNKCLNLLRLC